MDTPDSPAGQTKRNSGASLDGLEQIASAAKTKSGSPTPGVLSRDPSTRKVQKPKELFSQVTVTEGSRKVKYEDLSNPIERMEQQKLLKRHQKQLSEIKEKGNRAQSMKKNKYAGTTIELSQQIIHNKRKASQFRQVRNQEQINKHNQLLLERLVKISAGQHVQNPAVQRTWKKKVYKALKEGDTINIYPGENIARNLEKEQEQKEKRLIRRQTLSQAKLEDPPSVKEEEENMPFMDTSLAQISELPQIRASRTLHSQRRREEYERIQRENLKIVSSIYSIKPTVKVKEYKQDFEYYQAISQGLRRIRKTKIPVVEGRGGRLPPLLNSGSAEKLSTEEAVKVAQASSQLHNYDKISLDSKPKVIIGGSTKMIDSQADVSKNTSRLKSISTDSRQSPTSSRFKTAREVYTKPMKFQQVPKPARRSPLNLATINTVKEEPVQLTLKSKTKNKSPPSYLKISDQLKSRELLETPQSQHSRAASRTSRKKFKMYQEVDIREEIRKSRMRSRQSSVRSSKKSPRQGLAPPTKSQFTKSSSAKNLASKEATKDSGKEEMAMQQKELMASAVDLAKPESETMEEVNPKELNV